MIGAIIGDIVGSRFEWDNHRSKDFDLLTHKPLLFRRTITGTMSAPFLKMSV